jgi:hypothetical protein
MKLQGLTAAFPLARTKQNTSQSNRDLTRVYCYYRIVSSMLAKSKNSLQNCLLRFHLGDRPLFHLRRWRPIRHPSLDRVMPEPLIYYPVG